MKILLDENFPLRLYHRLRSSGYDVEHIIVLGQRGIQDSVIRKRVATEEIWAPRKCSTPTTCGAFNWTGITAEGKKCHSNKVPCHTDLEREFAEFLDLAGDVVGYFKNERFGFSVTYYENSHPPY